MSSTLQVLFIVGVAVNLIKGADLILRPHQQKWIQDKFDSLALLLHFTRPLDWYTSRQGAKKVFLIFISLSGCGFFSIFYLAERRWMYLIFPLLAAFPIIQTIRLIRDKKRFQRWAEYQAGSPRYDLIPFKSLKSLNRLHYRLNYLASSRIQQRCVLQRLFYS